MSDAQPTVGIVVCSTRPGRVGRKVANWFLGAAEAFDGLDATLLDLADFALPVYDEARHSRFGDYEHDHTKRWAKAVGACDGFAFVAPEYNHGPSPALVNALTYLGPEWAYKPAGFVSYGGRSGGLRAAQLTKPILNALKMYPTKNGVVIQSAGSFVDDDRFVAAGDHVKEANGFLKELAALSTALQPVRKAMA